MSWPEVVFDAPLMRGLDARGRGEIEAAGRMRDLAEGEALYRAGETGQSLYVVAAGEVSLSGETRSRAGERELRRVAAGESFGEESAIGASWRAHAVAAKKTRVAEVPVAMLRRALERAGGSELADRIERRVRRRAAAELLATAAFTSELDEGDSDMVLDATVQKSVERGETIYRAGEIASHLWIVADGMVQLQTSDDERLRVRAYLLRGDFFGDEEVLRREPRAETAVASGPALLLGIAADVARTVADRNPGLIARLRRVAHALEDEQRSLIAPAALSQTQHAFRDLYRLQVARSLLVIDLDACVRCGHCSSSCESLHGQARLIRHGDTIVTRIAGRQEAPLLLPTSCQHCENPACMIDCPTGAIGRDPRGEVFIRESLCTGCGACAKACPWDNIDMVARPAGSLHEAVAVKCDLCRGYDEPACVKSCPTEAIMRIDPREQLPDVARALRQQVDGDTAKSSSWLGSPAAWWGGAAVAAALAIGGVELHARGLLRPESGAGFGIGVAIALLWLALLGYSLPKRAVRLFARKTPRGEEPNNKGVRSRVRPQLLIHLGLGLAAIAALGAHGGGRVGGSGGAAAIGLALTAAFGLVTVLSYGFLPRMLSRLERRALLPEELGPHRRELHDQLFAGVSGKSELVKKLFERQLLPYLRAPLGWLALIASRRDLASEEKRVRRRIDAILDGRGAERLAGLDALIRLAVELRALDGQRIVSAILRAGLPAHIVAAVATTAVIALHVVKALGR